MPLETTGPLDLALKSPIVARILISRYTFVAGIIRHYTSVVDKAGLHTVAFESSDVSIPVGSHLPSGLQSSGISRCTRRQKAGTPRLEGGGASLFRKEPSRSPNENYVALGCVIAS